MQVNSVQQSPNFGMALRVESKAGVLKYIAGMPERIEEINKFASDAAKADKKLLRNIKRYLRENDELKVFDCYSDEVIKNTYRPEVLITEEGDVLARSNRSFAYGKFEGLDQCRIQLLEDRYHTSFNDFLNDFSNAVKNYKEAEQAERINKAVDSIVERLGLDTNA